jgi:hypothetical protein
VRRGRAVPNASVECVVVWTSDSLWQVQSHDVLAISNATSPTDAAVAALGVLNSAEE